MLDTSSLSFESVCEFPGYHPSTNMVALSHNQGKLMLCLSGLIIKGVPDEEGASDVMHFDGKKWENNYFEDSTRVSPWRVGDCFHAFKNIYYVNVHAKICKVDMTLFVEEVDDFNYY